MKKKLFSILCAGLMLTACGQQNKNETTMDFTDDVQVALADSGHIDLSSLQWTREPEGFEVKGDTILITTAPKTDLWQRTYYHFQNDNAPVLQMKAAHLLSLPERQCARIADEDPREVLQFRGEDRFYRQSSPF